MDEENRLGNHRRVAELDPGKTIKRVGVKDTDTILDFGAGIGVFTIPTAKYTSNPVYAYDIDQGFIQQIEDKKEKEKLVNVEPLLGRDKLAKIPKKSLDWIFLVTVYHEMIERDYFFQMADQLLKSKGKILIIEFYFRETPSGPPLEHRIDEEVLESDLVKQGYEITERFTLGENYYGLVTQKKG